MAEQGRGIAIVTESASFPTGMAGTSRVRLYGRGLTLAGREVRVFIVRGTEPREQSRNVEVRGVQEDVPFEYTSGRTTVPRSWPLRRVDELWGLANLYRRLAALRRNGWLGATLLYTNDLRFIKVFSGMSHRLGAPVALDLCEWPLAKATYYGLNVGMARRFMPEGMPLVDGVLPISDYLVEQIEEFRFSTGCAVPYLKVPIFVDTDRFRPSGATREGVPSFLWCGSLDYLRVVMTIVDAAVVLRNRGVRFRIDILGGTGPPYQREKLVRYISESGAGEIVRIMGFVPDEDLPATFEEATACLVPLRDDDISRSRFTTKLGEFLAMGRPVIASRLGELSQYLVDGVTAFFTRDLGPVALADAIEAVAKDRVRAEAVGRAGRRLAEEVFDYRVQGPRIASFLGGLEIRQAARTR